MKGTILVVGAGREGKGYLGSVFTEGGWKVAFLDSDPEVIVALRESRYEIREYRANETALQVVEGYETYVVDPVMDTTGAGDSFMGSLLYSICRQDVPVQELDETMLRELGDFCAACGAASTINRGSLLVMPDQDQVAEVVHKYPRKKTTLKDALGSIG